MPFLSDFLDSLLHRNFSTQDTADITLDVSCYRQALHTGGGQRSLNCLFIYFMITK